MELIGLSRVARSGGATHLRYDSSFVTNQSSQRKSLVRFEPGLLPLSDIERHGDKECFHPFRLLLLPAEKEPHHQA